MPMQIPKQERGEGGAGKRLTPAIKRWMKDQNAAGKKGTKGFDSKKRKGIGKCCQDIVARFSKLLWLLICIQIAIKVFGFCAGKWCVVGPKRKLIGYV